jgi:iron complex outermembrane receptor protein
MKKSLLGLSVCVVAYAQSVDVEKIVVEERVNEITIKNVSAQEIKSADLAEAIVKNVPSASLVRRSGIANDIILRGQKRDNINIIIDGAKVCGACVNRMDPPTSHVVTHIVKNVEISEGPFDVENFGTLSGLVNIETMEPEEGFGGEVSLNAGSFDYKKGSITLHGGTDRVKGLFTISTESSGQYEDGNGDDFAQQIIKATTGTTSAGTQFQPKYADMDAYKKTVFMGKIFAHITDNQDLKFSYTGNRSDDVLYPSSKMDAIWDDSDIYNFEYQIRDISTFSKALDFQFYQSEVDHPMSIKYRKSALALMPNGNPKGNITNHLTTKMQGFKLKNSFDLSSTNVTVGLDTSTRNWDGVYYKDINGPYLKFPASSPTAGEIKRSINDGETVNNAIFLKTHSVINNIDIDAGLRYDDTSVENGGRAQNNDYSALSANIFATFNMGNELRYFAGIGKSSRVPDVRELYFISSMSPSATQLIGTPTLDQTTNYEIDLGFEKVYDSFSIKTKLFYSMLEDYIYLNAQKKMNVFENIDATIYGAEISGAYLATDSLYVDYGLAYKKGEKDKPLAGQTDKDLAEISPLKANIGLGYEYDDSLNMKLDMVAASDWENYDSDNGEQALDGYMVFNAKINKAFSNGISLTLGVDNILDETYTTTNTYKDLTLITTSTATDQSVDNVMLLNEPGRYFYINATYKF